jgi:ABC-type transporter Mla subunit MlaD
MDVGRASKSSEVDRLHLGVAHRSSGNVGAGTDDTTSVAISKPADLLKKLSDLKQADPEKFKLVMGEVASNLKAAANPQSGAVGAQLSQLSDRLRRAANTGDLSGLQSSVSLTGSGSTGSTNRALEAYRRLAPSAAQPSDTMKQAMEYMRSAIDQASEAAGSGAPASVLAVR